MVRVYYSHPICLHGYKRELEELAWISVRFVGAEIINPMDRKYHWQKTTGDIEFFVNLVNLGDILVYSRLYGKVTAGVGLEVNRALENRIPVYLLEDGVFTLVTAPVTAITPEATRELYHAFWKRTPKYIV